MIVLPLKTPNKKIDEMYKKIRETLKRKAENKLIKKKLQAFNSQQK